MVARGDLGALEMMLLDPRNDARLLLTCCQAAPLNGDESDIRLTAALLPSPGAQIPIQDVPSVQKEVVMRCRQMGKPVIVASHLLQSMIEYPTPTRAEVLSCACRFEAWLHRIHNSNTKVPFEAAEVIGVHQAALAQVQLPGARPATCRCAGR